MTFPTDWDIEKYRAEHESEDHWELRRRFLETHKDKFPEERLVCLAQVFYNVEFMGCRYPEKTMRQVAELSCGVADDHREKMKSKLQRTFVQASDAASTKVKGRSRNEDTAQNKRKLIDFQKGGEDQLPVKKIITEAVPHSMAINQNQVNQHIKETYPPDHVPGRFVLADQSRFDEHRLKRETLVQNPSMNRIDPMRQEQKNNSLADIVLVETPGMNALSIIIRSVTAAQKLLKSETKKKGSDKMEHIIRIDNEILARATAQTMKVAKNKCADLGLARLKKICYTLVVKDNLAGSAVDRNETDNPNEVKDELPEHLAEDSKANRMMKLMGWGGKGLGKNQQGRTEPVEASTVVRRAGLGLKSKEGSEFKRNITEIIKKFKFSNTGTNLVFAADFSKEERAMIHLIAKKFHVKSTSYGKGEKRQLVLHRNVTYNQILEEVKQAGGSTEKYDLIPPEGN